MHHARTCVVRCVAVWYFSGYAMNNNNFQWIFARAFASIFLLWLSHATRNIFQCKLYRHCVCVYAVPLLHLLFACVVRSFAIVLYLDFSLTHTSCIALSSSLLSFTFISERFSRVCIRNRCRLSIHCMTTPREPCVWVWVYARYVEEEGQRKKKEKIMQKENERIAANAHQSHFYEKCTKQFGSFARVCVFASISKMCWWRRMFCLLFRCCCRCFFSRQGASVCNDTCAVIFFLFFLCFFSHVCCASLTPLPFFHPQFVLLILTGWLYGWRWRYRSTETCEWVCACALSIVIRFISLCYIYFALTLLCIASSSICFFA